MSRLLFEHEFNGTMDALATALSGALDALNRHNWCHEDASFCIRLCIEEALVNAMVHGNKNEPTRAIHLHIFDEGDSCRICVRDEGEGFDPHAITMPGCDQLGGRGVCLIKEFMEEVKFNCDERCLEMVFSRDTFRNEESSQDVHEPNTTG